MDKSYTVIFSFSEFVKEMDYSCDPFQVDAIGLKHTCNGCKHAKRIYVIHSNLVDAINDCSQHPKCTMVLNNKGYEQDFRLCKGIPSKTKSFNPARRNILYKKSNLK